MSIMRCGCGERHVVCVGGMRNRDQNGYFLCLRHTDSPKSCFKNIAQVGQHTPFIIVLKPSLSFSIVHLLFVFCPSQQHTVSMCACM